VRPVVEIRLVSEVDIRPLLDASQELHVWRVRLSAPRLKEMTKRNLSPSRA
jgi:hypothetical protein